MDDTNRRGPYLGRATTRRMDHVGIVVDDLVAAAFFVELAEQIK